MRSCTYLACSCPPFPPPRFCFCAYRVSPALGLLGRPSDARVQTQPGSDYLSVMTICLHPVPTRMRATTKKRRGRPDAGGQDCSMAWWWCWAGTAPSSTPPPSSLARPPWSCPWPGAGSICSTLTGARCSGSRSRRLTPPPGPLPPGPQLPQGRHGSHAQVTWTLNGHSLASWSDNISLLLSEI